jgi:hypothetical protein
MTRFWTLTVLAVMVTSAATVAQASPYSDKVLADNPLVYLNFDEAAGPTANNLGSLGAAGNGTYNNTLLNVASVTGANLGTAASFNGTNANVRIPDNVAFDVGAGPFSVELWFNAGVTGRGDLFTYKGAGGDYGIHSGSQAANVTSVFFNGFNGSAATPINNWYHLVSTRGASGVFNLYINGILAASGTDNDTWNIANDILIGSNHTGIPSNGALFFNGRIDEVAIYNTALTQAQVQAHFAAAFQFIPEPATGGLSLLALAMLGLRRRRAQ